MTEGRDSRQRADGLRDIPNAPRSVPRVAVAFIGTGPYIRFLDSWLAAATEFLFPECDRRFLIFTDAPIPAALRPDCRWYRIEHRRWPLITLHRFRILLAAATEIEECEWFLYLDADMLVNGPIGFSEMFDARRPLTGVQHPSVPAGVPFPLERDSTSTAFVAAGSEASHYWQGALWGGRSDAMLAMMRDLARSVDEDEGRGIIAVWHDESHLNRYFSEHEADVTTLDPGFAYPTKGSAIPSPKRILHLWKDDLVFGNTGAGQPRSIAAARLVRGLRHYAKRLLGRTRDAS